MIRPNHGTGEDAITFALDELDDTWDRLEFLRHWRDGVLDEWPEFYPWLDERKIAALVETSGLAEHIVRRSYMESVRSGSHGQLGVHRPER